MSDGMHHRVLQHRIHAVSDTPSRHVDDVEALGGNLGERFAPPLQDLLHVAVELCFDLVDPGSHLDPRILKVELLAAPHHVSSRRTENMTQEMLQGFVVRVVRLWQREIVGSGLTPVAYKDPQVLLVQHDEARGAGVTVGLQCRGNGGLLFFS